MVEAAELGEALEQLSVGAKFDGHWLELFSGLLERHLQRLAETRVDDPVAEFNTALLKDLLPMFEGDPGTVDRIAKVAAISFMAGQTSTFALSSVAAALKGAEGRKVGPKARQVEAARWKAEFGRFLEATLPAGAPAPSAPALVKAYQAQGKSVLRVPTAAGVKFAMEWVRKNGHRSG